MVSNQRKTILVISNQDMLRAGNQLLFRAIEGYIKGGFDVVFLTHIKHDPNLADERELFGELARHLRVVRVPFRPFLGGLTRQMKRLLPTRTGTTPKPLATVPGFPPPPEHLLPFMAVDSWRIWLQRLSHWRFQQVMYRAALRLAEQQGLDLVCGYEVMATQVARRVADHLSVPLFNRYQGTFLRQALSEGTAERNYPLHLAGTKVPADLHVMENDGTGGLEVLLALGHPRERILFMLDGVRKDIYQPGLSREEVFGPYGIDVSTKTRIILTLSKLSPWKRHDRIIGAMPAILKQAPDTYLVIAHRGSMRHMLEQYARELGVADWVIFTGPVPHSQIYRLLNACDVYVNCNDHSNLSNTVLEALVCGKPVVSINDGSLDGIVTHAENGLLVDLPCVRTELPAQMITLLKNDDLRMGIGHRARMFAESNLLSWDERMMIEVERVRDLMPNEV